MDYTAAYAKERLSGRGFFMATGQTQYNDLGFVTAFEIDFGIKRKEHYSARRGVLTLDRYDAYSSMGRWNIDIDEFVTPTLPFLWAGSANANFVQNSATGSTFNFNSKKGFAADIGKYGLFTASLTTPISKTEGPLADYVIDRGGGKVYIPLSSTIADDTACVVTYSAPALTYDSIKALSILNRPGTLEIHGEDDSGQGKDLSAADAVAPSRYIWQLPCILSVEKSGSYKVDDYRSAQLVAVATGQMTVKRLQ